MNVFVSIRAGLFVPENNKCLSYIVVDFLGYYGVSKKKFCEVLCSFGFLWLVFG